MTKIYNNFILVFFFTIVFFCGQKIAAQKTTIQLPKMANQVVNNFTEIATSENYKTNYQEIDKLKYQNTNQFFKEGKYFSMQTKATWTKFNLKNNYKKDTIYYLKFPFAFNCELFHKKRNQLLSIGLTGTNCHRNLLSVKNDEARIEIKLKSQETKAFYLQSKSLFYSNPIPILTIENYITRFEEPSVNQISENQIYVSLTYFFIGINVVFMFLALFRYVTVKRDIAYIIFVALNLVITLYNLSTYRIIIFEFSFLPEISNNEFSNYFADFMLLFYFLFFLSFLKLPKESKIRKLLIFGCCYYCFQIFIECSDFDSIALIKFSLFFLRTTPVFNIVSYLIIFIYLAFYAKTEYYFAKYGAFSILIGTIIIALSILEWYFKINIDPIKSMFISFLIYQIANLFDFIFFFYSLILIEKNTNNENNFLQTEILQNKIDLETTKKLIQNESIILKDKTQLNLKNLLYIKADDHYLNIFSNNDKKNHLVRGKLSEIEKELPPNFIKCHRSFIVNKNYIAQVNSNSIVMSDKSEIPTTRGFKFEE